MIAASAVVWKLKSVSAINSVVSTRIYPGRAPQGATLPYICVDRPPGQVPQAKFSTGTGSLRKTPVSVFCFGDQTTGGIKQAGELVELVRAALCPTSGVTASVQWNGTWIDHCTDNGSYEHIENPQDGGEVGWRAMAIDIDVFHMNC